MIACRTFKRVLALVCMLSVCCLIAMPLPYVTPRIVAHGCSGVGVTAIGALKSATCDLVLYSLLYCVIIVSVDLFVKTFSLRNNPRKGFSNALREILSYETILNHRLFLIQRSFT